MDTAQWPQDIMVVRPMEEILVTNNNNKAGAGAASISSVERKVRPHQKEAVQMNCPRCNSSNTKFCYYNNYSLSQPRYFCKTCRRYWTEGGTLRNIPVGGGTRSKNKRISSSSNNNNTNSSSRKLPDLVIPQDLNLGFTSTTHIAPDFKTIAELIQVPNFENGSSCKEILQLNPSTTCSSQSASTHQLLSSFMPMMTNNPNTSSTSVYSSSSSLSGFISLPPEFRPSLNFSLDHGLGSNYGSFQGVQEANINGKLLFPFEELNKQQVTNDADDHQQNIKEHQQGDSTGYWNGVMGGGSW